MTVRSLPLDISRGRLPYCPRKEEIPIPRKNNVYRIMRIARDLRVKDVASATGVTPAYISAIEAGKREPSLDLFPAYARALGTDENTLFHFRDPANQPDTFEEFLLAVLRRIVTDTGTSDSTPPRNQLERS